MLRDYHDIRSRISDPILWWDHNGVPRYCEFRPQECGVYDLFVALVEVGCQACREHFRVAVTFDRPSLEQVGDRYMLPTAGHIGSFHYGDSPAHGDPGCVGATMNVESVRVLEFWDRTDGEWVRRTEHEVYVGEHERDDDMSDCASR